MYALHSHWKGLIGKRNNYIEPLLPTLETVEPKPDYFCNGGDQNNNTIPETEICNKRGIELRDGFGEKIQSNVQDEISKSQREYYLREQMKAIQKELGEDEPSIEIDEIQDKDITKGKIIASTLELANTAKIGIAFGNVNKLNCDRDSQGDVYYADMAVSVVRPKCLENMVRIYRKA